MKKTVHFNEKVDADLLEFIAQYDNFSALCKKALRNEMNKSNRRKKRIKSEKGVTTNRQDAQDIEVKTVEDSANQDVIDTPKEPKTKPSIYEIAARKRVYTTQPPPVKTFINPNNNR